MRRIFFLAVATLLCAAGICVAAARLAPEPESAGDDAVTLPVLLDGEIRQMTMAELLPGVVAAEMPASFEPEALRAQAVAARTYILDRNAHRVAAHPDAAVCGDATCCCAWIGDEALREQWGAQYRRNRRKIRDAITATDGQTLQYAGEPIRAVFHSSSAGKTESSAALWGALPYLVSVDSPETAADVPGYETTVTLSPDEVRAALEARFDGIALPEDPAAWLGGIETDASGRVETIGIGGRTLTGGEARECFGLRSAAFTAAYDGGAFVFHVTGSGHGVGMSQYGANVMAKNGCGYEEILAHYYPGAELCGKAE